MKTFKEFITESSGKITSVEPVKGSKYLYSVVTDAGISVRIDSRKIDGIVPKVGEPISHYTKEKANFDSSKW